MSDDPDFDPLDISSMELRTDRDVVEVVSGEVVSGAEGKAVDPGIFEQVGRRSAAAILTDAKKRIFLEALARTGNVTAACGITGWSRSMPKYHREVDPAFDQAFTEAMEISTDALEAQARHLALNGVDEPIVHAGVVVAYRTKYSEQMLALLLKAKRRSEFGDKVEMAHDVKGGVLVVPGMASTSDWEAAAAKQQAEYRDSSHGGDSE